MSLVNQIRGAHDPEKIPLPLMKKALMVDQPEGADAKTSISLVIIKYSNPSPSCLLCERERIFFRGAEKKFSREYISATPKNGIFS